MYQSALQVNNIPLKPNYSSFAVDKNLLAATVGWGLNKQNLLSVYTQWKPAQTKPEPRYIPKNHVKQFDGAKQSDFIHFMQTRNPTTDGRQRDIYHPQYHYLTKGKPTESAVRTYAKVEKQVIHCQHLKSKYASIKTPSRQRSRSRQRFRNTFTCKAKSVASRATNPQIQVQEYDEPQLQTPNDVIDLNFKALEEETVDLGVKRLNSSDAFSTFGSTVASNAQLPPQTKKRRQSMQNRLDYVQAQLAISKEPGESTDSVFKASFHTMTKGQNTLPSQLHFSECGWNSRDDLKKIKKIQDFKSNRLQSQTTCARAPPHFPLSSTSLNRLQNQNTVARDQNYALFSNYLPKRKRFSRTAQKVSKR